MVFHSNAVYYSKIEGAKNVEHRIHIETLLFFDSKTTRLETALTDQASGKHYHNISKELDKISD